MPISKIHIARAIGLGAKTPDSPRTESASQLIDAKIEDLGDWRDEMLSRLRTVIKEADPEVVEEWKWRRTPVWSHNGLICTGETYKNVVKALMRTAIALNKSAVRR